MHNIISIPDQFWLSRLRRGHWVYLVKEQEFAKIEFAWEPPEPGCIAGRIGINRMNGNHRGSLQSWFIKENGCGMDNAPLLMPVEGNCPDNPPPISEPWQRHVERELAKINQRLDQLEVEPCYRIPEDFDEDYEVFGL